MGGPLEYDPSVFPHLPPQPNWEEWQWVDAYNRAQGHLQMAEALEDEAAREQAAQEVACIVSLFPTVVELSQKNAEEVERIRREFGRGQR